VTRRNDHSGGTQLNEYPEPHEPREAGDEALFEPPQMPVQIFIYPDIDDRVPDELPRLVRGNVTAALRGDEGDATPCELFFGRKHVIEPAGAAPGNRRGMLEQPQEVGQLPRAPAFDQDALRGLSCRVFHDPLPQLGRTCRHCSI